MTGGQGFCPEPQRPRREGAPWDLLDITLAVLGTLGVLAFLTFGFWGIVQGGEGTMPPQQHIHHDDEGSLMEWTQLITAITGLVAAIGGLGLWARRRYIAKKGKP